MKSRGVDADSPAVLQAFCAGQELALAEVYGRWSAAVYTVALRALADVPAAEQVTQGVFVTAWTARHTFEPDRSPMSTWLMAIAQQQIARRRGQGGDVRGAMSTTGRAPAQIDAAPVADQDVEVKADAC